MAAEGGAKAAASPMGTGTKAVAPMPTESGIAVPPADTCRSPFPPWSAPAPQRIAVATQRRPGRMPAAPADPSVEVATAPGLQVAQFEAPSVLHKLAEHGAFRPAGAVGHVAADPRAVVGQIALAVSESDSTRIEIRLDPPELGRVHIHLTTVDGGVQAVVAAQRPETQDLLRRHADTLAQELADAGYGDVSLDFSGGEATGGSDRPIDWTPEDGPAGGWEAVVLGPVAQTGLRQDRRAGSDGALDIRL